MFYGVRRSVIWIVALLIVAAPVDAAAGSGYVPSPSLEQAGFHGREVARSARDRAAELHLSRSVISPRNLDIVRWSATKPGVSITAAPPATTSATTATVSFSLTNAGSVTCSLDRGAPVACTNPVSYSQLSPGKHVVAVSNTNGSRTAFANAFWTIVAAPPAAAPTVAITSAPGSSTSKDAIVAFTTTNATFVTCRLDSASPASCSSPFALSGLTVGSHTVTVSVTNSTGSAQAAATWVIANPTPPPPPPPTGPAQPVAPSAYSVPSGAVNVSTSAQLLAALAASSPSDIVLADGVYDNAAPFSDANDHRLYAAHLGGAVLHAGIILGGNFGPGGALLRGLAFDVSDPTKTFEGGMVQTWGQSGRNAQILDTTFNGEKAVQAGILARQVEGLVVQRVTIANVQGYGLFEDENVQGATVAAPALLEDISVTNVSRPTPKSSNGTAEACIWLGNTATLRRANVSNCAWDGVWAGTAFSGGLVTDLTVSSTPTGVYMEHFTTNSTFQNMKVSGNVATGVNCEWADPAWGSKPGCTGDKIQGSTFDTTRAGVFLDQGTSGVTISGCRFLNQSWAAIGNYLGVNNTASSNDYSGIAPGAVAVTTNHM